MKEVSYTIKNRLGINPRPALLFSKTMQQFSSRITICRGDIEADGKNVYDILNLAVHMNDTITVKAAGQDEEKAIDTVSVFLNQKL